MGDARRLRIEHLQVTDYPADRIMVASADTVHGHDTPVAPAERFMTATLAAKIG